MKKGRTSPKQLLVDAVITKDGIDIIVNGEKFPITYPRVIWDAYPQTLKEVLADNIAYSSTMFLPQMLNLREISYSTSRPLAESFLFKNGIYDMPICAQVENVSSTDYVKRFFNTRWIFQDNQVKTPKSVEFRPKNKKDKHIVIPFSFGKESMLSFALARELGFNPILVSIIEPAHTYEYQHKKKLINAFKKEMGIEIYTVAYNPGLLRSGRHWDMYTEIGYGLQTTEYMMISLPFSYYFSSEYLVTGNEQSCNDIYYDKEDVLTYRAAYDQFREWTPQQSLLCSLVSGQKIDVVSFVEPLYEIAETRILHHRYPEVGKYQMSCFALTKDGRNNRWCQHCEKCAYMFPLFTAFNIDTRNIDFTQNIFDKHHAHMYNTLFTRAKDSHYYGSQGELGLAMYLSYKNGRKGYTIDRFKKTLLKKFEKNKADLINTYLGIHETDNIPAALKGKILAIYRQELENIEYAS